MATIGSNGLLGDMRGKIGTIVVTNWKGIGVVKSTPSKKKRKLSIKQERQNELFGIVMEFLSRTRNIGKIIKDGYQVPKKIKMSETNLATSYNMLHAFIDDGINYSLDLTKVKFSNAIRSTENGWNAQFFRNEKGFLEVTWELNPFPEKSTNLDDKGVMIFFNSTQNEFRYLKSSSRSSLGNSFTSNHNDPGDDVFCWLLFFSADGKLVSETEFLGMVKITA